MDDLDPKLKAAIERFATVVEDLDPRVRNLLAQVRNGRDGAEAMADLLRLTTQDPTLVRRISEIAEAEFQSLRDESEQEIKDSITALKRLPDRQNALAALNFEEEDLLFHPEGTEFPQLHPVVMAYIIERLQFDDDIPELRTGTLPLESNPAVPIANPATNMSALGKQLEDAAATVRAELNAVQLKKAKKLNAIGDFLQRAEEEPSSMNEATALVVRKAKGDFVAVSEGCVGVEGYKAGHKAQARETVAPSGQELAIMTTALRKRYAHKALTSSQGRRSAAPVIGALIQRDLVKRGYGVTLYSFDRQDKATAEATWTSNLDTGSGQIQAKFSFLDTASKVLSTQLARQIPKTTHLLLHVETVDRVADREVGWKAQVIVRQ